MLVPQDKQAAALYTHMHVHVDRRTGVPDYSSTNSPRRRRKELSKTQVSYPDMQTSQSSDQHLLTFRAGSPTAPGPGTRLTLRKPVEGMTSSEPGSARADAMTCVSDGRISQEKTNTK